MAKDYKTRLDQDWFWNSLPIFLFFFNFKQKKECLCCFLWKQNISLGVKLCAEGFLLTEGRILTGQYSDFTRYSSKGQIVTLVKWKVLAENEPYKNRFKDLGHIIQDKPVSWTHRTLRSHKKLTVAACIGGVLLKSSEIKQTGAYYGRLHLHLAGTETHCCPTSENNCAHHHLIK